MMKISVVAIPLALMLLSSCVSSVGTKLTKKEGMSNEAKGRALLDVAWKAQGFEHLAEHKVYEVSATDHWKGPMGAMATMWPKTRMDIELRYPIDTFDGQVTFKSGKHSGKVSGMQSQAYYEQEPGEALEWKKKPHAKTQFGINAYQYFFELAHRLRKAELITYAGEAEHRGQQYDLVLVTWGKLKAHMQHDQYTAWINKSNGRMDFCEYTVHDAYLPGGGMLPASIEFADFKSIDGVQIPFSQYVYLGGPKKKQKSYLHRLTVESFKFDSFDPALLYPNKELAPVGDSKPS